MLLRFRFEDDQIILGFRQPKPGTGFQAGMACLNNLMRNRDVDTNKYIAVGWSLSSNHLRLHLRHYSSIKFIQLGHAIPITRNLGQSCDFFGHFLEHLGSHRIPND